MAKIAHLDYLKPIAATCMELHAAAAKNVSVSVSSAVKLSDAQKARVLKALPKYTNNANFNVTFEVRVSCRPGSLC